VKRGVAKIIVSIPHRVKYIFDRKTFAIFAKLIGKTARISPFAFNIHLETIPTDSPLLIWTPTVYDNPQFFKTLLHCPPLTVLEENYFVFITRCSCNEFQT